MATNKFLYKLEFLILESIAVIKSLTIVVAAQWPLRDLQKGYREKAALSMTNLL